MGMNRSEMMAAVHSKNTKPEMLVRRLVHGMGYRYRLHHPGLPGKPDKGTWALVGWPGVPKKSVAEPEAEKIQNEDKDEASK